MDEVTDLKVTVTKVIFSNNGFYIFACKNGLSVKGKFAGEIIEGGDYLISGYETEYKGKPQIDATTIEELDIGKSREVHIAAFLADTFDGIGPKTSERLAGVFKEGVIDALLETPEQCALEAPGLSSIRAIEISGIIDEIPEMYKTLLQLRIYELSKAQSEIIWNEFGPKCLELIKTNPYTLMRCKGIGFESCDRIADLIDFDLLDPHRFEGALVSSMQEMHLSTGDTYTTSSQARVNALAMLGRKLPAVENMEILDSIMDNAVELAVNHKHIVVYKFIDGKCSACDHTDEGARIALTTYFHAELTIKREVESFLKARKVIPDKEAALKIVDDLAGEMGYVLDESQRDAIYMSMYEPLSIITGGPGTGKTTITGILSEYFKREKVECAYCAPTGRAAKRLSEAAGVKATTIHRLLEINGESTINNGPDFLFGRDPENPIDARVILIDETSMVDAQLFKMLLMATPKNASIILIGDADQLPSVGPGNLLKDLLSCEAIPRVSLNYVFRQESEGSIAFNSRKILNGEMPESNDDDFCIINTEDDNNALQIIKNISPDIDEDSVILCPTKQNILGTTNLNYELQSIFSSGVESRVKLRNNLELCSGDKVMQIKNNYKIEFFDPTENEIITGIYNGEIGIVSNVDFMTGGCDIKFDGGRCVAYDKKSLADIDLAYAMTVHKAQGCEFNTVVIVLGKMNYRLSNRKILYTAVTRGKKKVIIIDSNNRLRSMIKSNANIERNTSLGEFLSIVSSRYI